MSAALDRFAGYINTLVWSGAAVFLVLMLLLVFMQIIARYLIQDAPPWTEEAARFAMIWSGLLGGVAAFHQNADPVLVEVKDTHPIWMQRAQAWSRTVCVAVFTGVLLMHSMGFVQRAAARETEALNWNLGVIVSIIPIYAALILILAVLKLVVFELNRWQSDEI